LKRCRKVGDLSIERKPEVIVEHSIDDRAVDEEGSRKADGDARDD